MQMRPNKRNDDGQFKDYNYNRITTRRVTAKLRIFRLYVEIESLIIVVNGGFGIFALVIIELIWRRLKDISYLRTNVATRISPTMILTFRYLHFVG